MMLFIGWYCRDYDLSLKKPVEYVEDPMEENESVTPQTQTVRLRGLPNIGNSCYMNSALQILFHTPHFIEEIKSTTEKDKLIDAILGVYNWKDTTNNLGKIKKIIEPKEWDKYKEGDSLDFFSSLIDKLRKIILRIVEDEDDEKILRFEPESLNQEEVNNIKKEQWNKYSTKYVSGSFNNMFGYAFYARRRDNDNLKQEHFHYDAYDVLEIPASKYNDLANGLDGIFWNTTYNLKEEKHFICYLPAVFPVMIMRATLGSGYCSKKFSFPEQLDLEKFVDKDIVNTNNFKYNLYGVIEKQGESKDSGHYYSTIKVGDEWYKFSDSSVRKCELIKESDKACGLFYVRGDCQN